MDRKLRELQFIGSSRNDLRNFPVKVRRRVGHELQEVQYGGTPLNAKSLKGFKGVIELAERFSTDTYRTVYIATLGDVVYVLHCFKKKSKRGIKTPKEDIDLIKTRLAVAKKHYEEG